MRECWAEGDLRAYLDGELPVEEGARLAAHLQVCAECRGRHAEIERTAAQAGEWMAVLADSDLVKAPLPGRSTLAYVGTSLALAAGLAIGFVMLPKRGKEPARFVAPPMAALAPVRPPDAVVERVPVPRPSRPRRPVVRADYYLPLDNEPIETGTVMRVGLADSDLQAELILGPDGRAHAIRMVSIK
jgi:anti-sigma factor RsiW